MVINDFFGKICVLIFPSILFSILVMGCSGSNDFDKPENLKKSGDSCLNNCDYIHAMDFYTEAVKEANKVGDVNTSAAATCNIGILYGTFNDPDRGAYYFKKAFDLAKKTGNRRIAGICVTNLLLLSNSKYDNQSYSKLLELKKKYPLEDKTLEQFWTYYLEGFNYLQNDNTKAARQLLLKAKGVAEKENLELEHSVLVLVDLGTSWLKDNKRDSAIRYYKNALVLGDIYPQQKRAIYRELVDIYSQNSIPDSVLKYQSLLLQLNDSVYNQKSFNVTKNNLTSYEEEIQEQEVKVANWRLIVALCVIIPLAVFLVIIYGIHRNLRKTYKILWEKNNLLLQESEENRKWKERCYELEVKLNESNQKYETASPQTVTDNTAQTATTSEKYDAPEICDTEIADSVKLDADIRKSLDMRILKLISDDDILFDPNLTINTVASMLKVNSKYVSLTISETYGMNFRSFINKRRINEVCHRLADNDQYGKLTIAAIAAECGFKSTNNFIVTFKKFVGMTPLKYRNYSKYQDKDISEE